MPKSTSRYVLCVRNGSYRASLEPRKVYRVVEDSSAEAHELLRVVDESGEDYLFPADLFVPIELPSRARPAFARPTASGVSRPARRSSRPTNSRASAAVTGEGVSSRESRLRKA
jgi:hypothetical protein